MKKSLFAPLLSLLLIFFLLPAHAQRGYIRSKIRNNIERDMEKKHLDPQRERGRESIKEVTYENDRRYPAPENRVKATLSMSTKTFKENGQLKNTVRSKFIFGPTGECMVMNEGDKDEVRMLFDYEAAANYMVSEKDKTATKMPMINLSKMMERMSKNQPTTADDKGKWEKTNEQKTINNYACRKYIYTSDDGHMDVWVTQDISIDLSDNHLLGSSIKSFASNADTKVDENLPLGLMVRNVYYEKKSANPTMQMDVTSFTETYDPKYFNLSGYAINDVLDKL